MGLVGRTPVQLTAGPLSGGDVCGLSWFLRESWTCRSFDFICPSESPQRVDSSRISPNRPVHGIRAQVRRWISAEQSRMKRTTCSATALASRACSGRRSGIGAPLGCDESSQPAYIRCRVRMRPSVRFFVCASSAALLRAAALRSLASVQILGSPAN